MKLDLSGKTALITASSRGIGAATAEALVRAGANVGLCGRDEKSLASTAERLDAAAPGRVVHLAGDIRDKGFLEQLVDRTASTFGRIDILVNNNGGPPPAPFMEHDDSAWLEWHDKLLLSTVRCSRLVVPFMQNEKCGRIINLTSTTAREPVANLVLSNVYRAAVVALGKTLSLELGPYGITVNSILTGGCATERFTRLIDAQVEKGGEPKQSILKRIVETIPLRRVSEPTEFVRMIVFLASDASSYVTGTAIPIDGGASRSAF